MASRIYARALGALAAIGGMTAFDASAQPASFTGLGDLFDESFQETHDISADGSIVCGRGVSFSAGGVRALMRDNEDSLLEYLPELAPPVNFSDALAASADGSAIVGYDIGFPAGVPHYRAFRWGSEEGTLELSGLDAAANTRAYGISANGLLVAGYSDDPAGGVVAVRWNGAGQPQSLGFLPNASFPRSEAYGISANGLVVVGSAINAAGEFEGFRWQAETGMVGLGRLYPGSTTTADVVSGDGSVIAGNEQVGDQHFGFAWTAAGGLSALPPLPNYPDYVIPLAMTPDASVIIGYGYSNAAGESAAWIWDAANGTRNLQTVLETDFGLDLSDWRLGRATGISADGRTIVGDGTRVSTGGGSESWIAFLGDAGGTPGDLDGDGDVDLADLAVLLANFGRSGGVDPSDGDIDGDDDVDLADLAVLLANFGTGG